MARVDIRGDPTDLYYIEVNVNPGKNRLSYLPTAAYSLGLEYPEIVAFIPYQGMLKYGLEPPKKLEELVKPILDVFGMHCLETAYSGFHLSHPKAKGETDMMKEFILQESIP
jgi:hypothetical protein